MKSEARSVSAYLAELPPDRRKAIKTVRAEILRRLPEGYDETMDFGMITYVVPLEIYPDTYNNQPLMYAALANQKNHMAVYLSAIYGSDSHRAKFEEAYAATGKRYDCGKSCVRFRRLDELPLEVVGDAIAAMSMESFIAVAKSAQQS